MTHHLDLDTWTLDKGQHESPEDGACLLELAALFAGEPFTDAPSCVSPVLAAFGRAWNDGLNDTRRQELKRYVPRLIGTAGDGAAEQRRGLMAAGWLVTVHTPAWLRLAGLTDEADALAALTIASWDDVVAARPLLDEVRRKSAAAQAAAQAAAWYAARSAAGDAAREAAGDAAREAAGDAARYAAGDAAWDAARAAAGDAAWYAARDAAGDAAWAAAWAAARAAAWEAARAAARAAAWEAARDAARDAADPYQAAYDAAAGVLRPVTDQLFVSAHDLFDRMIDMRAEVTA